jgi:hypothetical protein
MTRTVTRRRTTVLVAAALAGVPAACGSDPSDASGATTTAPPAGDTFDVGAARQYCKDKGGTDQVREAVWGTNNDPSAWVRLPGQAEVCRFQTLHDQANSVITVDLKSL